MLEVRMKPRNWRVGIKIRTLPNGCSAVNDEPSSLRSRLSVILTDIKLSFILYSESRRL